MRQSNGPAVVAGVAVALGMSAVGAAAANAAAPGNLIQFAPHRAIYEITLERASSGSGVVELAGRMVYELNGSGCEGYTQNMRFVTRIVSQDGSEQVNDLRTSSWEDGKSTRLRFNSEQYRDAELVESTSGDARRNDSDKPITVEVTRPAKQTIEIDPANMFPMQHSRALLKAAGQGERQLVAGLYDGSDKGEKVYQTSAWIGARVDAGAASGAPAALAKQTSWPISIAYFEAGSAASDALPAYELTFRLFENGVSTSMLIDYGDFAVRGELKELTYYKKSDCVVQDDGAAGR